MLTPTCSALGVFKPVARRRVPANKKELGAVFDIVLRFSFFCPFQRNIKLFCVTTTGKYSVLLNTKIIDERYDVEITTTTTVWTVWSNPYTVDGVASRQITETVYVSQYVRLRCTVYGPGLRSRMNRLLY